MKTFDLSGQLRDTSGKPVHNAVISIDAAQIQTRSDNKGNFEIHIQYNKKNGPYILSVQALAHQSKTQDLFLEVEKKKELSTKIILEPKKIFLPYRKTNIDYLSQQALESTLVPPKENETKTSPDDSSAPPTEASTQENESTDITAPEASTPDSTTPDSTPVAPEQLSVPETNQPEQESEEEEEE
jgi:hypothetical protein